MIVPYERTATYTLVPLALSMCGTLGSGTKALTKAIYDSETS